MKALQEKRISLRSLWRRSLVILSLVALVFAACGDSSDNDDPLAPPPAARQIVSMTMLTPPDNIVSSATNVIVYEGMPLDLTGFSVLARYGDGSYETLTDLSLFQAYIQITVSGEDYLFESYIANDSVAGSSTRTAITKVIQYIGGGYLWGTTVDYAPASIRSLERLHYTYNLSTRTYYSDEIPNWSGITLELRHWGELQHKTRTLPRDYVHWRFSHINEVGHWLAIAIPVLGLDYSGAGTPVINPTYDAASLLLEHTAGTGYTQDNHEHLIIPAPSGPPGDLALYPHDDANIVYIPLDEVIHITGVSITVDPIRIFMDDGDVRIADYGNPGTSLRPGLLRPWSTSASHPMITTQVWPGDAAGFPDVTSSGGQTLWGARWSVGTSGGPLPTLVTPLTGTDWATYRDTRNPLRFRFDTPASVGWFERFKAANLSFTVEYGPGNPTRTFSIHEAIINRHDMDILWEDFPANRNTLADRRTTSIRFIYRGWPIEVPIEVFTRLVSVEITPAEGVTFPVVVDGTLGWIDRNDTSAAAVVTSQIVVTATYMAASTGETITRVIPPANNLGGGVNAISGFGSTTALPLVWDGAVGNRSLSGYFLEGFYGLTHDDSGAVNGGQLVRGNNGRERQLRVHVPFYTGMGLIQDTSGLWDDTTTQYRNARFPVLIQGF